MVLLWSTTWREVNFTITPKDRGLSPTSNVVKGLTEPTLCERKYFAKCGMYKISCGSTLDGKVSWEFYHCIWIVFPYFLITVLKSNRHLFNLPTKSIFLQNSRFTECLIWVSFMTIKKEPYIVTPNPTTPAPSLLKLLSWNR